MKQKRVETAIVLLKLTSFLVSISSAYFIGDAFALLCLSLFILSLCILIYFSIKIIESGNIKIFKDFSNTAWNISTASSFSYAVYLLLRYKIKNPTSEDVSISYIILHPYLSFSVLGFLIFTAMVRASVSVAEIITTDYSKS